MEPETTSITLRVARALAEIEGVEPHQLEYSLYNCINTEALELLMTSKQPEWELTFRVPDHTVTVHGTGAIEIDGELVDEGSENSIFKE
ncbi:HalOD1 output domain-containing protein [Natronorubrum daqingense]|uniref:Halobacterial output domain-containing protein n=1 Tax=Natronorubrum daqingense TaxID=588898 RepID=A0A1N7ANR7_9EURY|nr:HalOD1 output domain-containing protein [Natronorubrum daqingense]SIR40749.1 hypothetical protein SAMN05421809_1240 [Natronorubrum daqingense]